ncbi:MAG: aldose 1-epimerase family protein [Propionibacteriaceae bacterium]
MVVLPSGTQYEISAGSAVAVVHELGAALRTVSVAGVEVVRGGSETEGISGGHGQHLIPWPNRLRDGRYSFEGAVQQLPLSEPARHNASHGLTRWVPWQLVEHTASSVTQQTTVFTQPGWPGVLHALVSTTIAADGLTVEVSATNVGATSVPFGYGAHPYLTVGEQQVDEVTLSVPAGSFLEVDDRLLPTAVSPVEGTAYDFRSGRPVADTNLDTAMTDLQRDADGRWRVSLALRDRRTTLWGDASCSWAQVFTGGPYRDRSIAVEPMTCGPDAFNDGPTAADVIILAPGAVHRVHWGVEWSL